MIKRSLFIQILLLLSAMTWAQKITVNAPSAVSVGEQFRLQYTINTQDVSSFKAGNIPEELEVLMGPSTSSQSSFQMVNGHTSSSSSITYTYILSANKNGVFTIPAAHARVRGKDIASVSVRIKVSGSANNRNSARNGHSNAGAQVHAAGSRISGSDLFIRVSANKRRVYEQEPVVLTYKVYTQVELTQLEGKMPDLTGFHTQEVQLPQQKSFHIESVNGRPYRCVTWSQYVMFPQMTGKLKVPSITYRGIIVQENRNVDPFEAFFNGGSGYVEVKKDILAPGIEIQVDPLPKKPAGFSGGVGRFNISAQLNKKEIKANNPITLRVIVGGIGNLKLIKQPEVKFPKDFDKYDAKVTDKTRLTANGLEGNIIYDILAVPRNQGKYTIPAVEFTYYDTSIGTYKTIRTQSFDIQVGKGDGSKSNDVNDYSDVKDQDIRPLRTGTITLHRTDDTFFGSAVYWICLLIPFVAFIVLLILFRKRALEMANGALMRDKKADKVAKKRLKLAGKLLTEGRAGEFYDEVLHALWGYIGDKLNLPVEQLSRENIAEKLSARHISQLVVAGFIAALDECEFERYAPGDEKGNMNKTFEAAISAITNIDNEFKTQKRQQKKTLTLLFLLCALSLPLSAITKENGDKEYAKGNYQQAIKDYEEVLKGGVSADIYYNLGNAYYRIDNIPRAVLAYERAALLSPGDRDIRFNLQMARSKTIDKITPESEMFFITWGKSLVNIMGVDGWAYTAIISITLSLLLILIYLFGTKILVRKIGFWGSGCLFLLFLFSNICAYRQNKMLKNRDSGIIIVPSVTLKKTPSKVSSDLFVIHEGTKVEIEDGTMAQWYMIRLADGREGWISASSLEVI